MKKDDKKRALFIGLPSFWQCSLKKGEVMRKFDRKYYIMLSVIYLFIFEFALMGILKVFGYWDELYAVTAIPLLAINLNTKQKSNNITIWMIMFAYILIGIVSNLRSGFITFPAILIDILLNSKFVLGIYTTYYLFKNCDVKKYYPKLKKHIHAIVLALFILVVIDEFCGIFPCNEIRYGLRSEQLFFGHPTGLASVSFFLLLLEGLMYHGKTDNCFLLFGMAILASTLRSKALGVLIIYILLFIFIVIKKKRVKLIHIGLIAILAGVVGWEQIYDYFFGPAKMYMARGALLFISFKILQDYFPFGTGLGTYASAPSGDYYSAVYPLYELNKVYGLSEDFPDFISDTFWPMIIGQTGIIGIILYSLLLMQVIIKISNLYVIDRRMYFSCIGAMCYLFVSSTSESAFVNPLSLPLSFIIGLGFLYVDKNTKKRKTEKSNLQSGW